MAIEPASPEQVTDQQQARAREGSNDRTASEARAREERAQETRRQEQVEAEARRQVAEDRGVGRNVDLSA